MSSYVNFGFIALVAILYSILVVGVLYVRNCAGDESSLPVYVMRFCVGGFLLVTGLLALQGSFAQSALYAPVTILIALVGVGVFSVNTKIGEWLAFVPASWLILIQTFRLIVELILHALAKTPLFPREMSFSGRNFDIIIGVTAPLVALLVHKLKDRPIANRIVVSWNVLGLLLLTNVFVTSLIMRPIGIGVFPYIWLPAFLVPYAYLLHFLSLRKAKQQAQP